VVSRNKKPDSFVLVELFRVFLKWKIHFWRWSSMRIYITWSMSGFGRLLIIPGILRNPFNHRQTCCHESVALAGLQSPLVTFPFRLWFLWGCCLSGETYSPSSCFGHLIQNQTYHSEPCRSPYPLELPSHAAKTDLHRLRLPSAQRTLYYPRSELGFCFKVRHRNCSWSIMISTS